MNLFKLKELYEIICTYETGEQDVVFCVFSVLMVKYVTFVLL